MHGLDIKVERREISKSPNTAIKKQVILGSQIFRVEDLTPTSVIQKSHESSIVIW